MYYKIKLQLGNYYFFSKVMEVFIVNTRCIVVIVTVVVVVVIISMIITIKVNSNFLTGNLKKSHTHTHTRTHPTLTVMARVVLVLVLLVFKSPGGGLGRAVAENCTAAEDKAMEKEGIQVTEGGTQVIKNKTMIGNNITITLFVKPESDFKGVHLEVHGSDGTHHATWFPAEFQFSSLNNMWYQTQAWASANASTDGNTNLIFGFHIYTCKKKCRIYSPKSTQYSLSVVAHGASKWLTGNSPDSCNREMVAHTLNCLRTKKPITCEDFPTPTPTATTKALEMTTLGTPTTTLGTPTTTLGTPTTKMVVVVVVGMVVMVVTVVMMMMVACLSWKPVTSCE